MEIGSPVIINQFRMVTVKEGTDPKKVKVLADALAKVAASDDFKAYLRTSTPIRRATCRRPTRRAFSRTSSPT